MKNRIDDADIVRFQVVFQEGEIKFGYIFLEKDRKLIALHELLVDKNYAEKCDKIYFEKGNLWTFFIKLFFYD